MKKTMKATLVLALAAVTVCIGAALAFADDAGTAEVDADGFSIIATGKTTKYDEFQAAVENVEDGQTIYAGKNELAKDMVATVSDIKTFTVELMAEDELIKDVTLTAGDGYTVSIAYGESGTTEPGAKDRKAVYTFKEGEETDGFVRLSGDTRLETMLDIVSEYGSDPLVQGGTVILCTCMDYPDALAASSLAGLTSGSIVLTNPDDMTSETKQALQILKPTSIIIVGGYAAVSLTVEAAAENYADRVSRIAGDSRYDTAASIFESEMFRWSRTCIITTGENYADALSISPLAYAAHMPIFLTQGGELADVELEVLQDAGFTNAIIVGGTSVVSETAEVMLNKVYDMTVKRLSGSDRYETSKKVAAELINNRGMSSDKMVVATGTNFPDALCGGVLAGRNGAVLTLTNINAGTVEESIDAPADVLDEYPTSEAGYVLGGTSVISNKMQKALNALLLPKASIG